MRFYITLNDGSYEVLAGIRKCDQTDHGLSSVVYIGRFKTKREAKKAIKDSNAYITENNNLSTKTLLENLKTKYRKQKPIKKNNRKFITKGVYKTLDAKLFGAQIKVKGKYYGLGRYKVLGDALKIRQIAMLYRDIDKEEGHDGIFQKWYDVNKEEIITYKTHEKFPEIKQVRWE